MTIVKLMEETLHTLDDNGSECLTALTEKITAAGITANMNVGGTTLRGEETAKWWLGQVLALVDENALYAMDALIGWGHGHFDEIKQEQEDDTFVI